MTNTLFHSLPSDLSHYAIDSRLVQPKGVFFALKGKRHDGHDYIYEAMKKGASLCVVERAYEGRLPKEGSYLWVDNSFEALCTLAKERLQALQVPVLGITGSVGKTTTKDMLNTLLSTRYSVYASPRSYNSQHTLPLNLLNAPAKAKLWVLEMGLSKKGELTKLVNLAPPSYALLTGVYASHIAFFKDLDELAMEKAQIFSHPQTQWGLLPQGIHHQEKILEVGFCLKELVPSKNVAYSLKGSSLNYKGTFHSCLKHIPPQHFSNLLLAIRASEKLGLSPEAIAEGIKAIKPSQGRFRIYEKSGISYIDDCYNAAPFAMEKSLEYLPAAKGKKIAFLGDMKELGAYSSLYHRKVLATAFKYCDLVISLGKDFASLKSAFPHAPWHAFEDFHLALEKCLSLIKEGDVVLVKGARTHRLERLFIQLQIGSYGT